MLIAVLASLAAGASFAAAALLQQRAAAQRPGEESLRWRLVGSLARQPLWLAGIGLAVVAYGFQALALAFGPLSLVQPLIVSELVFALPLSARRAGLRLGRREWLGVAAVSVGLATALAAARPQPSDADGTAAGWAWTLGAVGAATVVAVAAARRARGPARASLLALGGGLVMGTQSVLLAAVVDRFQAGPAAVFTAWQSYGLIAASAAGLLLIQSAFHAGPLAASTPVLNAVEPAVAVALGVWLLGETVRTGWAATSVTACGAALVLAGIVVLDTSPVFTAVHDRSRAGRPDGR